MDSTTRTVDGFGFWNLLLLLLIAGVCGALEQAITGVSRGDSPGLHRPGLHRGPRGAVARPPARPARALRGHEDRPSFGSNIGSAPFVAVISLISRPRR